MTQKFCLTGFETDRLEEGWTGSSWDTFDEQSCLKEKHNKQKSLIFNVCMQKNTILSFRAQLLFKDISRAAGSATPADRREKLHFV